VEPTVENLKEWFDAGVICVGIGSNLITKEIVQKKDWVVLKQRVSGAIKIARMFAKA
jgi:2-dehydro-3-deoxyphosphogluconate aldolase / (4S)-4-hydroxy-2-oxoglutarate aldolase